jgi:hypothetical protein
VGGCASDSRNNLGPPPDISEEDQKDLDEFNRDHPHLDTILRELDEQGRWHQAPLVLQIFAESNITMDLLSLLIQLQGAATRQERLRNLPPLSPVPDVTKDERSETTGPGGLDTPTPPPPPPPPPRPPPPPAPRQAKEPRKISHQLSELRAAV